MSRLDATADAAPAVPLPQALAADGGTLEISLDADSADPRVATVHAEYRGLRTTQRLTYARRDGAWVLTHAELAPTAGIVKPPHE